MIKKTFSSMADLNAEMRKFVVGKWYQFEIHADYTCDPERFELRTFCEEKK